MLSWFLLLLAAADTVSTPRAIVAMARAAVEGDSAGPIRARWSRRLATNPHDRLARLGLANLDRFADDAAAARPELAAILADRSDDAIALYAELTEVGPGSAASRSIRPPEPPVARRSSAKRSATPPRPSKR
jgi:transposase